MATAKSVVKGPARRDGDKERVWRERIADQQRGGASVRAFCRKLGLHEASFYHWRKELRLRDRETVNAATLTLAPVVVIDEPCGPQMPSSQMPSSQMPSSQMPSSQMPSSQMTGSQSSASIEIVLGDGTTVRVPPDSTREQLATVIAILEPARC